MAIFDVSLYEPITAVVTVDTTAYSADNATWPTADGGVLAGATEFSNALVNANFISAEIVEPISSPVTSDTTLYTADNTIWPTADGGILEGARDFTDAEVIAAIAPIYGGVRRRFPPERPLPVIGIGYGVLPELEGEAFGTVILIGKSAAKLPGLIGAATGCLGIAGQSAGELAVIRAAALGRHGQIGTADAIFKAVSVASDGTVAVCGTALGMIAMNADAIGRYDDDEAAVMTFLLAA